MNITKVKYQDVQVGDKIQFKMDGEKTPLVRTVLNIEPIGKFLKICFDDLDDKGYSNCTVGFPNIELNKVN